MLFKREKQKANELSEMRVVEFSVTTGDARKKFDPDSSIYDPRRKTN